MSLVLSIYPSYSECINILISIGMPYNIIDHSISTCITAMSVSSKLKRKFNIDCNLVIAGSLLHDIGRVKSHKIDHGIIGTKILKEKGLPDNLCNMCSIHLFAGLKADEAIRYKLPKKDFIPRTIEEKIITHADNISKDGKILSKEEMVKRFRKYLQKDDPILIRTIQLYENIELLIKNL